MPGVDRTSLSCDPDSSWELATSVGIDFINAFLNNAPVLRSSGFKYRSSSPTSLRVFGAALPPQSTKYNSTSRLRSCDRKKAELTQRARISMRPPEPGRSLRLNSPVVLARWPITINLRIWIALLLNWDIKLTIITLFSILPIERQ